MNAQILPEIDANLGNSDGKQSKEIAKFGYRPKRQAILHCSSQLHSGGSAYLLNTETQRNLAHATFHTLWNAGIAEKLLARKSRFGKVLQTTKSCNNFRAMHAKTFVVPLMPSCVIAIGRTGKTMKISAQNMHRGIPSSRYVLKKVAQI